MKYVLGKRPLKNGGKVVYAYPDNGYKHDQDMCQKYLTLNESYMVSKLEVGNWHTDVWLEGFEHPFNSVMFGTTD